MSTSGLMAAIERKTFADVRRSPDGGRGVEGVFARDASYWNPFEDELRGALAGAVPEAARLS